ncbi:ABC transporter substrate-binding protein [Clostridium sp.]|uniref:ABC transporter substrate-binding protein n=1 Tax=Clostridium sp. TaxID=1506 RepID=UPI003F348F31
MKKLKLITTILLTATLGMTLLTGCGGTTDKAEDKPSDSGKQTEITWWNFPNFDVKDGSYEKEIVEAFEAKNPDIKVKVEMISFNGGGEKINAAIASNSAPDVLYDAPGRIIDYGRQGLLADVNDMIDKLDGDVQESILQGCRIDETYYMYPFNTTVFNMAVNKTMFEEAGLLDLLPLDREGRTWTVEEFEKALRAIKEAKPDVVPMTFYSKSTAGDQGTRAFLANLYGGSILNDDLSAYTLDSPEMVKSMEWVKAGVEEGIIGKGGEALASNDAIDLFINGKAAFTILYSPGLAKSNIENKVGNFEDVMLALPSPNEPKLESLIGGLCVFDNGDEAKIEASKKFIDFLCNDPEWQEKNIISTGTFSVRDSIKGLYDSEEMKAVEAMGKFTAPYYNTVPGFAEMRTHWFPALQEITLSQKTPEEALKALNEKANATLKNN